MERAERPAQLPATAALLSATAAAVSLLLASVFTAALPGLLEVCLKKIVLVVACTHTHKMHYVLWC